MSIANVGGVDRVVRIIIGLVLFGMTCFSNVIGLWGLLGVIPLITGFMRFCPLYTLLGFSTCKRAGG
ncbi:MAG: DUF2892 domain-containing protein [Gammaproteobacteria bacterium]